MGQGKPVQFRVASEAPPTQLVSVSIDRWLEAVAKESSGRIKGTHFPAGQLFKDRDALQVITQKGALEFAAPNMAIVDPNLVMNMPKSLTAFGGIDAVGGPMLRQMKQLGIKAKFMGGDGICTEQLPSLAGDGIGDAQVICAEAGGVEDSQKKGLDEFRAAYRKKFGTEVKLYAPYVYDAVMVMVTAMQKADSIEPAKYLPELVKTNYQGITGAIAFDANGDMKHGTLTLFTYRGAKRTQLAVVK